MKKQSLLIILILISVSILSACNNTYGELDNLTYEENIMEEVYPTETDLAEIESEDNDGNLNGQESQNNSIALFDSDKFNGGVEDVFYAGDDKVLVYADTFYLYDMVEESFVGDFSVSKGRVVERKFFTTSDGYALVGVIYGDASASLSAGGRSVECWLFDKNFTCCKNIDLVELVSGKNDFMVFAAAVSKGGNEIAIAGNDALYLYDIENDTLSMVFDYDKTEYAELLMLNELYFMENDEKIVFTGMAMNPTESTNTPVYGQISVDGSCLVCNTASNYVLTDEIIMQDNEVWFPEAFDKATGKMLVTDTDGQIIRVVSFEGEDTGADGVFGSTQGKHIATIQWMPAQGGWRVRIYDANDGTTIHEQLLELSGQNYSTIICKVRILDEWNECIVIAGKNQETQIFSFFF